MADRPLFIRLSMPSGLEDALEGLAREVLRAQPKDLLEFSADYFEGLLRSRNKEIGLDEDDLYGMNSFNNGYIADHYSEAEDEDYEKEVIGQAIEEQGNEFDIDLKDPDTQQAATKIQASFRGSQARKEVVALKQQRTAIDDEDTPTTQDDSKKSIEIQMPTQEEVDEVAEEEVDIDLDDPELEGAATKIQAGYRGMKTRQELKNEDKEREKEDILDIDDDTKQTASKMRENKDDKNVTQEEEFDIDLDDPQTQVAATKIQASFRGSQTRKVMQEKKSATTVEETKEEEEIDIDLNDPEVEQAATKIQAGFKGKKARDEVQKMKEEKNREDDKNTVELDTEEIDIDLNDPEVEMAATKIQAGFKGKKAREEVRKIKEESEQEMKQETVEVEIDIDLKDPEVEQAATKIQAGYKGMKTRKELKGEPKDKLLSIEKVDIDLKDPEVEEAATKIQAGYKGMKTRKELKEKMEDTTENQEIDIDLNDPEVEMAATKIQAGYKGMKTRKEMKVVNETEISDSHENGANQEDIDIDLEDPEVALAATKIQAGYKGMKTRKELNKTHDNKLDQPEDVIDIDLKDPEVEMAATKIQAGYKGMKTRKGLQEKKDQTEVEMKNGDQVKEDISMDIDLNDPEVGIAATKIQAGYKGMKTRKDLKRGEQHHDSMLTNGEKKDQIGNENDLNDPDMDKAATKIQAGYKGMKTRKEIKKKKYDESIVKNIDPDMEVAATKIQAGYRGMRDRGKVKQKRLANIDESVDTILEENAEEKLTIDEVSKIDEEIDIDLNDPEVELAATKIQAGFKGKKARDEVKMMKENNTSNKQSEGNDEIFETPKEVTEEEIIDIDLNDPEVEMAATKIQAGFKGKKARDEVEMMKKEMTLKSNAVQDVTVEKANEEEIDIDLNDPEVEMAATKIQAGFKGKKARDEVKLMKNEKTDKRDEVHISKEEEEEIDIDLNDPEVEMAATKIQAGFKGKKARDEVKMMKNEMAEKIEEEQDSKNENATDTDIDIDLNDPEVEMAATKIQAGFKGKKARDEVKMMKNEMAGKIEEEQDSKNENATDIDIDLNDPEVEMAATKIQAGFKGKKAREEVKMMKEEMDVKVEESQQINEKAVEEEIDIDLNDPEVEMAATKIQAGFKGKKARDEVKMMKTELAEKNEEVQDSKQDDSEELLGKSDTKKEVIDIDLNDPDVEIAATKIQAGYKGMKTRKELKESSKPGEQDIDHEEDIDIDLTDPEVEVAATKIQAGYKGMKARKDLKDRRQGDGEEEVESIVEESGGEGLNGESVKEVNDNKPLKSDDVVVGEVKDDHEENNQDKPEEGDMKEEIATEMLIQGAAEGQEQELRPQSHTDDGYTSPEQTLTAVSSFDNHSPVKSLNLELTGTAALIHDPNSEILLVSQESVTDSELLEVQCDLSQSTDDRLKVRVTEEEMMEEESMMSSLQTVANADDLIEDQVDTEHSQEKSQAPTTEGDVIEETVDEVEEVTNVGATPFDQYKGHPQIQESEQSMSSVQAAQDEKGEQLMLYYSKGSYNSEKVLVYLYERGIEFSSFNVDLSQGEQFAKWFLKLNPKAEVPVLTIKDPTKESSDPRALRIITDSTRIMHSLDSKFSDILSPTLVPVSSDTAAYQLHVYFAAILDQIPLNTISHGVAFHDHLAIEPESPYVLENYEAIREMVMNREEVLNEAAITYAAHVGSDTDTPVIELRKKATSHKHAVYQHTSFDEFKKLLKRTSATLDKAEAQLKKAMADNSEDDCEGWLLGHGFSVVDIILGVMLQRLARLGLRHYFWSHGKRPFIHKFIRQIQQRRSFTRALQKLPLSEISGPKPKLHSEVSMESRISLDEMDVFVNMENSKYDPEKKVPPLKVAMKSKESMEVFNVLHESHLEDVKEDNEVYKTLKAHQDQDEGKSKPRTTWKQLWVSDEEKNEDTKPEKQ